MNVRHECCLSETRRHFFGRTATGIGTAALAMLLNPRLLAGQAAVEGEITSNERQRPPHFAPKASRVIYIMLGGGPSQMDLFDYKPKMADMFDQQLPQSVIMGQRLTTLTSGQARLPIAPSIYKFRQYGKSGAWVSELLPHLANVVDDMAIIRSTQTDAINHDPAITFILTGSELPGRPSAGAWMSYGLGSSTEDLPAFMVLHSRWTSKASAQPVFSRLWGSGFLPTRYQGISLRSDGDPVLYLSNPQGVSNTTRRRMLDGLATLNQQQFDTVGDPEILTRMAQYEMSYRMQTAVPELSDLSNEPESTFSLYGSESRTPGSFAANCILARRMAERGVRFVQIFHRGWDHHDNLTRNLPIQCKDIDQPCAGLITDLKQRGMLDDTLVVCAGEFGRTIYCQGELTKTNYGRDHHPRCFAVWLAGGGIKPGIVYGATDDFCYNIMENPVHVHDLNATILHCLGIDHERLTYRFQGREFRLTDVHGSVVQDLLA
jgi:hypothetical protein